MADKNNKLRGNSSEMPILEFLSPYKLIRNLNLNLADSETYRLELGEFTNGATINKPVFKNFNGGYNYVNTCGASKILRVSYNGYPGAEFRKDENIGLICLQKGSFRNSREEGIYESLFLKINELELKKYCLPKSSVEVLATFNNKKQFLLKRKDMSKYLFWFCESNLSKHIPASWFLKIHQKT